MTRVLIAEDSNVIQKLLHGILEKDPTIEIVGTTYDGEATVQEVKQRKPDMVIMDYRMPKLNAPDMIKQIMSDTPVPILIFTGADPTEPKKKECLALGAVGFMEKPKGMDYSGIANQLVTNIKTLSRLKPSKRTY
ncbi:MAG TPA: response regulator [Candidatus Obscuribacterales bacterium]